MRAALQWMRGSSPRMTGRGWRARRINPLASCIFSLTRVTRIFQKNVFTKTAPAGPAGAVAGFLLRARERGRCGVRLGIGRRTTWGFQSRGVSRSACSCTAIGGCRNVSLTLPPCFRPVIYREHHNSAVSPWIECARGGAIAAYGASRTWRQAGGRSAIFGPGLGFAGGPGLGWSTASVNQ